MWPPPDAPAHFFLDRIGIVLEKIPLLRPAPALRTQTLQVAQSFKDRPIRLAWFKLRPLYARFLHID